MRKRLGYFNQLLLTNAETANGRVWIDRQAKVVKQLPSAPMQFLPANDAEPAGFASEKNVLAEAHLLDERQLLENSRDVCFRGGAHAANLLFVSFDEDLTAILRVRINTSENLHQR